MYLLKPAIKNKVKDAFSNLHSTMYLLKPEAIDINLDWSLPFTFHYVSIKTIG